MSILLSLLLAQARVLPEVDRRALDLQARAEALQTARPARQTTNTQRRTTQPTATAARQRPAATQARTTPVQRPASIRRASGGALDLSAITTICRAAGNQADPATFLATLSRAYSLSTSEGASLRTSCAAYLAGRADARTNNYGAPAH